MDELKSMIGARVTEEELSGSGKELIDKLTGPVFALAIDPVQRQLLSDRRKVVEWAKTLSFPKDLATLDQNLFRPITERRETYQAIIKNGLTETPDIGCGRTWASDGSHKEGEDGGSTVGALIGPLSGAYTIQGQLTSSLHGERIAAIAALIATKVRTNDTAEEGLLTDHLETVRLAERVRSDQYRLDTWRERPGHELYAWLVMLLRSNGLSISHIKAHTGKDDEQSRMNELADTAAKEGHGKSTVLPALTVGCATMLFGHPRKGILQTTGQPISAKR